MSSVAVEGLHAGYAGAGHLGIGDARPRLSWRTVTDMPGWTQHAYELEVDGAPLGEVESSESVFVPWPAPPLGSRKRRRVRVRVRGTDDSSSPWSHPLDIEAGLLEAADWIGAWITSADGDDPRPQRFRRTVTTDQRVERARLYITSAGIHHLSLNGRPVSDHVLAPGWTAYSKRLHYLTHDVTDLLIHGANQLDATVADGWWRGQLGWEMRRNVYGDQLGLLAQLELTYADGTIEVIGTDDQWLSAPSPWESADLYDGEAYDARRSLEEPSWSRVARFAPGVGELVAPTSPPVRRTEKLSVHEILTTPSGKTVLDFGQNLVGWVRFTVDGEAGTTVMLRHAEVLEDGELGTRPLRNAKATDRYTLAGGGPESWEPSFTFHGFRYVEIEGWPTEVDPAAFTAVVIHSDLERTGTFTCSNEQLNQLHQNVMWGMRGNFVDVPTDCPQRDERLGWTGDLQVFAPSATFLYDVGGFLADWLADLRVSHNEDGAVPVVIPYEPLSDTPWGFVAAAWGDAATVVPWVLYERYGDVSILEAQFESMRAWVEYMRSRADGNLWPQEFQLGDWLDPMAPPDQPWRAQTDAILVASAYYARSTQIVADTARLLDRADLAAEYDDLAATIRSAFRDQYVAPSGRISSDSVTAYALAIAFDLYETDEQRTQSGARLALLAEAGEYRIATGFVGTPIVLPALTAMGDTTTAYRMLTESGLPSWLYPVTMGATTIWERWDAMLPDGSINPGEMTSFNHYAFGSVADWMHQVIGGIAPAEPGYKRLRIAPIPGRGVTSADCSLRTPYGMAACRWMIEGDHVAVEVDVPPNTSADVLLPGGDGTPIEASAGSHRWDYEITQSTAERWRDA